MPEYLSPGVFIEEIPARLKAIEGVSTSTAGFVGAAERGTVPGYPVPGFNLPATVTFEFPIDRGPVLITSFAEFNRRFGGAIPLRAGETHGYLARAVHAFFDNGGKRCFVARVVHYDANDLPHSATRSSLRAHQGTVLRLARDVRATERIIRLTSLRRVDIGGGIAFFRRDGTVIGAAGLVTGYDTRANTVTLSALAGFELDRDEVFAVPGSALLLARNVAATDTVVQVTSLRRVDIGGGIAFFRRNGTAIGAAGLTVTGYDTPTSTVTLSAAAGAQLDPNEVFAVLAGATPTATGPRFFARTPGRWSERLSVEISNSDGPPIPIAQAGAVGDVTIQVQSSSSFYLGAFIEIDHSATNAVASDQVRTYHEVTDITGNVLTITPALANTAETSGFVRVVEIDIQIEDPSAPTPVTEVYRRLPWNERDDAAIRRRHYSTVINARSALVYVLPPWADAGLADSEADITDQPTTVNGFEARPPAADVGEDNYANIDADDYQGLDNGPGRRTGIQCLQDGEDIRIVAAPGQTDVDVQNALITQCERMRYRFALLDGEAEPDANGVITAILAHRNNYDTSYAAYYTPWIADQEGPQTIYLPPSGPAAGIYARVDNERGVWKAPANEVVRGATGLFAYITTGEQDLLNPRGVNCIRRFEGRGIRVWGARTLSSDPEFRYVNVRRFLIFLEASLDRGTQWVVFEPNAPETWSRVTDSVSAFLHTQWRNGALFGRRPEDAFFVRCDETTMTADDVQNGRLICEIGVAIVRPAEFVIFRIEQITGFARQQ